MTDPLFITSMLSAFRIVERRCAMTKPVWLSSHQSRGSDVVKRKSGNADPAAKQHCEKSAYHPPQFFSLREVRLSLFYLDCEGYCLDLGWIMVCISCCPDLAVVGIRRCGRVQLNEVFRKALKPRDFKAFGVVVFLSSCSHFLPVGPSGDRFFPIGESCPEIISPVLFQIA